MPNLAQLPSEFTFMPNNAWNRRWFRALALLIVFAGMLVGGGLIGSSIAKIVTQRIDLATVPAILLGVFTIYWVIHSASATFVTSAKYELTPAGLRAGISGWFAPTIPWNEISTGTLIASCAPLPYRRLEEQERMYVLQVSGLSVMHSLASLYYGMDASPRLFITPDHDHYRDLARLIWEVQGIEPEFPPGPAQEPAPPIELSADRP